MSKENIDRRKSLKLLSTAAFTPLLPKINTTISSPVAASAHNSFRYCLNMSTIRGQKSGFIKELETASKAGFRSVEIWMNTLQEYFKNGGSINEAKKRISDLGLTIENSIGFGEWIVDDEDRRKKGLEQMKKEMELLVQIGCKRIAAPPAGATTAAGLDLRKAADRYRSLLELGDIVGIIPHLELWGSSKNLSRLSEVYFVALESGHSSARVLLDIFHLYKGGTTLQALSLINPDSVEVLHMNDYPPQPSASNITDAERIYPGDGAAPTKTILQILGKRNKPLVLSTEVFNKDYYKQDALVVAKTALEKMKKLVSAL